MRRTKVSKNGILVIALLLLIGITSSYVAGTYAKYVGEVSGSATATVAKWNFETDNAITSLDINLSETYDASTLVADRIAPGTSGSFSINVVNTNSETGVDFEVALGTVTNAPTNLKFYSDDTFKTEIVPGTDTIEGTIVAGDSTGLDIEIYWQWAYEQADVSTGDAADTADGEAAETLTIPVTITGTQSRPSTTAITTVIK